MDPVTREHPIGHFERPELFLSGLAADVAADLIAAAADVALILDASGVICDMAFGNDDLQRHGHLDWLGKPWSQIVTIESRPKVEAMLEEALQGGSAKWRHINHSSADGADLPLSYAVIPVRRYGSSSGASEALHSVAFGRDLRGQVALQQRLVSAQLSVERDYWRLRQVETRYRLLFHVTTEAVLILDAVTEKVEEANPAAYALLGEGPRRAGWTLAESLDTASAASVRQLIAAMNASGRSDPVVVHFANGAEECTLSASLFRQETSSRLLIRFTPTAKAAHASEGGGKRLLLNAMESAPDAFVVTDLDGRILSTNRAFLELAQLANEELARGESLEKWLGRSGVDLNVLISNLRQRGAVRLFATQMRGEYGSSSDVEISAVAVTTGEQPCLGFTIRDVGRRLTQDVRAGKELPRSASQMTELIGRVPLKDIVRETTDLIEQMCIDAALELTGDNRAAAAEMLGLSRQSLYVKLRRFGIGDVEADGEP